MLVKLTVICEVVTEDNNNANMNVEAPSVSNKLYKKIYEINGTLPKNRNS